MGYLCLGVWIYELRFIVTGFRPSICDIHSSTLFISIFLRIPIKNLKKHESNQTSDYHSPPGTLRVGSRTGLVHIATQRRVELPQM